MSVLVAASLYKRFINFLAVAVVAVVVGVFSILFDLNLPTTSMGYPAWYLKN